MNLLACESCKRQINVTALQPGGQVRCACNQVLTVGVPRDVKVRGLFCSRCGGTVTPDDEACSFCSAALSVDDRKESLLCPGCLCRLPDDSQHCKACGIRLRARALPPLPLDGACPGCKGSLRHWIDDKWELVECSHCGGIWCSNEVFDSLRSEAVVSQTPTKQIGGEPASPLTMEETFDPAGNPLARKTYLPCLDCAELMVRRQFRLEGRSSRVVLDVCRKHGTWFDRDELHQVLAFVTERRSVGNWVDSHGPNPIPNAEVSLRGASPRQHETSMLIDFLGYLRYWIFG